MQALCGAELRWSPPNWKLRNLGGRACFHLQQTPTVFGRATTLAPIRCCERRSQPAVLDWRGVSIVAVAPWSPLAGRVAYRRLFAGILLCCAKELLFCATGATRWASIGWALGLPFMRNSDIRYADTVPSAVGGITRFACEYAKERGIDVEALLQKSGLTPGQIEQPSVRLSVRSQIKFLELAARAFQDDFLGFHLAQKFELRAIGLLYYVLASSDTLDEALQRAARYSTIVNEGIVLKFRNGKESGIAFEYVGVARRTDRHQIEFWMTALVRICRQLTGRRLPASRVQVAHQRSGDTSEMSAFFGGDVMFGAPVDEVAFPESSTPVALVGADSYLNHMLVKYCEEALARRETNRSPFGLKVENAITLLLPHGKARVGEVARKLGVSQRTLARRLASEGQTFAGVLQSLRSDLAKRHLADEGLSISQIAWLLGYQDVSAFTHAFKRWTGRAPGEVRQQSS